MRRAEKLCLSSAVFSSRRFASVLDLSPPVCLSLRSSAAIVATTEATLGIFPGADGHEVLFGAHPGFAMPTPSSNAEDELPMPVPFSALSSGILGDIVDSQADDSRPVPPRRRIHDMNGGPEVKQQEEALAKQDGNQPAPRQQHSSSVKNLRSSFETRTEASSAPKGTSWGRFGIGRRSFSGRPADSSSEDPVFPSAGAVGIGVQTDDKIEWIDVGACV